MKSEKIRLIRKILRISFDVDKYIQKLCQNKACMYKLNLGHCFHEPITTQAL